jgi:hypothetical protein
VEPLAFNSFENQLLFTILSLSDSQIGLQNGLKQAENKPEGQNLVLPNKVGVRHKEKGAHL